MTGRPSIYSEELAAEICSLMAEGESLRAICALDGMPGLSTVMTWLGDEGKSTFREQYARAQELRGERYAEKVAEVGEKALAGDVEANAARAAIDAFKWSASKFAPKRFGDKVAVTGADGENLKVDVSHTVSAIAGCLAELAAGKAGGHVGAAEVDKPGKA